MIWQDFAFAHEGASQAYVSRARYRHYTFAPEDADRAAAILRELQDLPRREPGVVNFDVARSNDRPNVFACVLSRETDECGLGRSYSLDRISRVVRIGVYLATDGDFLEVIFAIERSPRARDGESDSDE
jgi:hypothetical protein